MVPVIGIRREDKNRWEKRTPLIPKHIEELARNHLIQTMIEPSEIRAFSEQDYLDAGAEIEESLSSSPIIFAIKEIPPDFFEEGKTYLFFSHTMKGQYHNMPMLRKMMDKGCSLIDYEAVTDEQEGRLLAFGRYAGLAGMIDSLWALGKRLDWEGISNPFQDINQAYQYDSLKEAKQLISNLGQQIKTEGLPDPLVPIIFGIAGYGRVSHGAQEILDLLPIREIVAEQLSEVDGKSEGVKNHIYKVIFKEKDTVKPRSLTASFQLQDYYDHPKKYISQFSKYLPNLTLLINATYWENRYPRLVTKNDIRKLYVREKQPKLKVIGDISCDIEGTIEVTTRVTDSGQPVFVYDLEEDKTIDGYKGRGSVIMAVDNLPCEFPKESSKAFSEVLKPFVPSIATADFSKEFDELKIPPQIKKAVILHHGELTPDYRYLEKYL